MLNVFGKMTCVIMNFYMFYGQEEMVDNSAIAELSNMCQVSPQISLRILLSNGVLEPVRNGVYRVVKKS